MDTKRTNISYQSDLAAAIQSGRALIVCGAGISMAASGGRAPSWKDLIESAIEAASVSPADSNWSPDVVEDCKLILSSAKSMHSVLEQLNCVQEALGGINSDVYRAWLGSIVGRLTTTDSAILMAIESLTVSGSKIATTNYDTLIAQHLKAAESVSCLYPQLIDDLLDGRRRGVWHLHGCYDQPQSVVFSANDYRRIRGDDLVQFLQRLASKNLTLVFIGCSPSGLADDNVGHLLKWFGDNWLANGKTHFVLCRERELSEHWPLCVTPVSFGTDFPELFGFLGRLAPKASLPGLFPTDPAMVGRTGQRQELVDEILKGTSPIIVPGGPGMGKTTLALSAAHHPAVAAVFENRRVFVPLDGANDAVAMLGSLAHALGAPATGSLADLIASIRVRAKDGILAILDNLETPWQHDQAKTEDMIGQLAVPGLVLVLTIRGKTPPIGQCLADVKNITYPNEATEIFLRSAGGRRRALAVDPDLSNLVAVLEGHPLSLRLLGSAAQGFGDLVSLRRRWEAAKADLLREGPDETRLTSTRASFRASLASPLLINSGKRLLGLLSLLPTGMEREDADLFLPGEGHEAASNVVSLQLVNEQAGRLTMLAPLREAALKENPADVTDRLRLIDHFLGVAKQAGKAGRKDWSEVRERVTREAGNLDAMCLLAIDEHPKPDLLEALRGLARFYRFTTMGSVRSLERAARHFEDATRVADAASCLMSLGAIAVRRLDNEVAQRYFSKALPMFREARSIQGEANCIQGMAKLELDRARYGDAEDYYRKAAALYKFVDDELGNANCIRGLGDIARGRNDYEAAKVAYEACIPIYQKVNDTLGEAICNKSLGDIALDRGDLESAQSAFQQAIPLFQELGDVLREAECRQGLGDIAERQSQAGRAAEQWRAALTLFSRIGYLFNIGHAHVRLSRVATNPEERQSHCAAASAAWLSIDRPDLVSHYME